jgi:hypothetical protein
MIEVPVILQELLRAATGHPITVATADGEPALLRLSTPDEALQSNRRARAAVERLTGEPVSAPELTQDQAEQLCAPLRWPL